MRFSCVVNYDEVVYGNENLVLVELSCFGLLIVKRALECDRVGAAD